MYTRSLDYLEVRGSDDTTIVLLHGFGANAQDLSSLARWLDPQGKHRWLFPQAPWQLFGESWAWFPKEQHEQESALQGELWASLDTYDSTSIDDSLSMLDTFLATEIPENSKFILGGFSQGSMMSWLYTNRGASKREPAGLILLSTALVAQNRLQGTKTMPPTFQSHGNQDPILEESAGLKLRSLLEPRTKSWEYHGFAGGHSIPDSLGHALRSFIEEHLGV